jgi:hypothetical protein
VTWLKQAIREGEGRLKVGFLESYHRGQRFSVTGQEKACRERLRAARQELAALNESLFPSLDKEGDR